MTPDDLLGLLARLRQARVGDVRVPHKPLLLLWLFGRFAAPAVDITYASWHNMQVFKGDHRHPQRKDGRPHAAAAQSAPERALSGFEAADAAASRDE